MTLKVPVYHPAVQVTLYKTIKREKLDESTPVSGRFQGIAGKIDLTPYLGEGSSMRTMKSVREPAGGFSLTIADKAYNGGMGADTLYGLIEPMDFLEIRMSRTPSPAGIPPAIVMRGFVSDVSRQEGMSPDGKPMRVVTIGGQDYGKLWQMLQILYLPGYIVGQDTLSAFRLFERFGAAFKTSMTGKEFLTEVVDKILNPYIEKVMPENSPNPRKVTIDEGQLPKHGTTSVAGPQNREGTIHDLLRTYLDVGIWNELFIEDREDGVYCVYRPNPYKSVAGEKIQDDAPDIEVIDVPADAIASISVSRSDANVANYYWVRSPAFELNTDIYRRQFSIKDDKKTVLLDEYPNSKADLYGIRVMNVETAMGGDDVKSFNSGQKEEDHRKRDTSQVNWINDRRRILVEQNKDNVVFEHGSIRIKGDERIRAGMDVRVQRGTFSADYYVTQVVHDFVPYQPFVTTLMVERGRGFIERARREGGSASPYYAEMS